MKALRLMAAVAVGWFLVGAGHAWAAGSGALRVEVPDAGAAGKGSAFVGEANTPAAVYYNPAGLNQIKTPEFSAGFTFIGTQVTYKGSSGTSAKMRENPFYIPNFYAAIPVKDKLNNKLAIGVGGTSYFGLGTQWNNDGPLRYDATKNDILNQDYMLTASYQLNDQWSLAAGADNDYSKVDQNKMVTQAGGDGFYKLKGSDDAWGYRIAAMFKLNDRHQFGLMYRSRINHTYHGKTYLDGLNTTYASSTYFGSSSYQTKVTEKFALPQSVVMGYSFKPTSRWTFNADVEWMDWSALKQQTIVYPDESNATRLAVLNAGNPAPRDWHSAWSQAVGAEYAARDNLRLRCGYFHHASPIPKNTWEPNLPDSNSHGITTGLGYDINKNFTLDLAYGGMIYEVRKVTNTENSAGGGVNGRYRQYTHLGYLSLTYKM